ncbi:phosphotransferase [Nocardiopsis sp. MG754419]|uniref:phosphotransferase n=1 Tax=Nocardiopsis sp. MG754419 TaxID=2259865 RepID=UPI001BAB51D3|nr:phosphotransferase [Nocardiopsis sp. MG754419]MBR8744380.1 hypothetical protein [Nocardiopsis sp. MG754419]
MSGTPPAPLASGRDADVFALDDHRVLRRYRYDRDTAAEATVMRHVAAHGFPVPAVHRAEGRDMEMERLHGPTMLSASLSGELSPTEVFTTLVDLHRRLHELPARLGPGRILHMDLHPDNVMLTDRGPVVIDWCNAREGDPDLDLALTALLVAMVSLTAPDPLAGLAGAGLPHYVLSAWGDPARLLEEAAAERREDPNLTEEEIAAFPRAVDLVRSLR